MKMINRRSTYSQRLLSICPEIPFDNRQQEVRDGVLLSHKRHRAADARKHEYVIGSREHRLLTAAVRQLDRELTADNRHGPHPERADVVRTLILREHICSDPLLRSLLILNLADQPSEVLFVFQTH